MKRSYLSGHMSDESDFSFVSASTFVGKHAFHGKTCRCYEHKVEIAEGEKQTIRAWIDDKTSRPVGWSDGVETSLYSFDLPVPKEPLVLPPEFEKEVARYRAYYAPPRRAGQPQ